MTVLHRLILSAAAVAGTLSVARAHHGRDFLVVQDYTLPAPWSGNLLADFTWERTDGADEFTLGTGFFLGVAPRLGFEASIDFLDEDNGWEFASVDPALLVQLTSPESTFPVRVALSAGYQFGAIDGPGAEEHEEESDDHGEAEHGHHDEEGGDEDAHEHSGIHRHGEDLFHARLILESDFTDQLKGVVNLIGVVPDGDGVDWGYAAGLRYAFNHTIAAGLEAIGDFAADGEHELMLSGYLSPVHSLSIKLGVGTGLTTESPDFTLHTGLVWRF